MFICAGLKAGLGVALLAATAVQAATIEDMPGSPPVISQEATRRFLGGVRDYGDGRPSPNILYSTAGIGESLNSPAALKGPSVVVMPKPPAHTPLGGGSLQGGTISRGSVDKAVVSPQPVTSSWR
jgi:hypothetical protein